MFVSSCESKNFLSDRYVREACQLLDLPLLDLGRRVHRLHDHADVLPGQCLHGQTVRMQKELEEKEFTAKAGGGMVTAVVNGNREVTKIEIKPEAVDPDDVEMLEDLVLAAVNEALRQYEAASDATVNKIAGGMKLGF